MNGFDPLKIGAPSFKGFVVGVTDIMSYLVAFAANATYLGHDYCSFQYLNKGVRRLAFVDL
jgi:hypothetical protein